MKLTKKQKQWLKVDKSLCFICQKNKPEWKAIKESSEEFLLCDSCKNIVKKENETENAIKMAIYCEDTKSIFRYLLGADLNVIKIEFTKL